MHRLSFLYLREDDDDPDVRIIPAIDGVSLVDHVGAYESARGYDIPGSYAGLTPYYLASVPTLAYFHGAPVGEASAGRTPLLGCDCGVIGCWPLQLRIKATADVVSWSNFHQPFRSRRDYSDFGPFIFDRELYDAAVAALD